MLKKMTILLCLLVVSLAGCNSIKLDGFSLGFLYWHQDLDTHESGIVTQQPADELLPILLVNFKFE